jgi:hypothetical protein
LEISGTRIVGEHNPRARSELWVRRGKAEVDSFKTVAAQFHGQSARVLKLQVLKGIATRRIVHDFSDQKIAVHRRTCFRCVFRNVDNLRIHRIVQGNRNHRTSCGW